MTDTTALTNLANQLEAAATTASRIAGASTPADYEVFAQLALDLSMKANDARNALEAAEQAEPVYYVENADGTVLWCHVSEEEAGWAKGGIGYCGCAECISYDWRSLDDTTRDAQPGGLPGYRAEHRASLKPV